MRRLGILLPMCAVTAACPGPPAAEPAIGEAAPPVVGAEVPSADGVPIAYTARGEGDVALVFIHGGFADASFWSEQVEAFAARHRVVTLDLAGHGESGMRTEWTLAAFGEDVAAVVEALDLPPVVLVGHSLGGAVALEAARRMPDRVVGVIAVDTLQNADAGWDEKAWQERKAAFREDFDGTCRRMAGALFHDGAEAGLVASVTERLCDGPPEAAAMLESFNGYDRAAAMRAVAAPIRAINGDLYPTNVEGNRRYAPGFDAVIMEGVGHFPMLERPDEFNRHLAAAVAALAGG